MKPLLSLAACLAIAACSSLSGYTHYGKEVTAGKTYDAAAVLADPVPYTHQDSIRVKGTIHQTCKKQGCWIRVGDANRNILVRTKDHEFLVPTDSDGREVIVEGKLMAVEHTVAMRKHLLEDAGQAREAAMVTEPERGYELVAEGIAIKN